jgi:hypothetical protein
MPDILIMIDSLPDYLLMPVATRQSIEKLWFIGVPTCIVGGLGEPPGRSHHRSLNKKPLAAIRL